MPDAIVGAHLGAIALRPGTRARAPAAGSWREAVAPRCAPT